MNEGLTVTPYGGAGEVTGSNFLVEASRSRIIVDCGIEQGRDYSAASAYEDFPFDVSALDALVITHAHLDHVGRAPRLMKQGFKGKAYMTAPTRDLMELILRDSAHILAEDAERRGLAPLYTNEDIDALLSRVETIPYHTEKEIAPGLSIYLRNTGHILGSASVRVKAEDGTTVALTGDIGGSPTPLLPDAEAIPDADVVLMESVYGDRQNPERAHRTELLKEVLNRAVTRGGAILMPSFSIERTQLMLYEIGKMVESGDVPKIPIFLDSPLAINVTAVYEKWGKEYFNANAEDEAKKHDLFAYPFVSMTRSHEESEDIRHTPSPKLIIAGAGMSHGGRIGGHEVKYLPDEKTTLIMVGYQAPGTPGRLLQDGAKRAQVDGQEVIVRAKVETLTGWSGHADRDGLLAFAESCLPKKPATLGAKSFLIGLGEPSSARFLAQRIHDFLGVRAIVIAKGQTYHVTKDGVGK